MGVDMTASTVAQKQGEVVVEIGNLFKYRSETLKFETKFLEKKCNIALFNMPNWG